MRLFTISRLMLFTALILLFGTNYGNGEDKNQIIEELNESIIELPATSPLDYPDHFFEELMPWDDYEVVGLGEATHGTKEFFELKHRIFKFLVENHNFKVLAYEFSFRKSLKINDFVLYGKGEADSLFSGESWIQDNREIQNLIEWMREYNINKPENEKVYFVGIDNQLDAFYPEKTIEQIKTYYPSLVQQNEPLVTQISDLLHINYKGITLNEFELRRDLFNKLLENSELYFSSHPNLKKTLNYEFTIHLIESLIKSNQWLYNIYSGKENNRDSDLARNALWVKNCFNSKIAVWAHNAHVQNNPHYYSDGGAAMGYHLKNSLNDVYLIVSTSFSNGKFKAVMEAADGSDTPPLDCEIFESPPEGSINSIFVQAGYKNFFMNVDQINPQSELYSYLDTPRPMIGIGDFYAGLPELHFSDDRIINLTKATDLIFYFSDTSPINLGSSPN